MSNCSLSMLKYFPDLMNVDPRSSAFLKIFFIELFKRAKSTTISKLANKLREEQNRGIRQGIKEYISEHKNEDHFQPYKQSLKMLRRFLMLQEST